MVAYAYLCSVVLYWMCSFNLEFSSITGELTEAGLCSVVLQESRPRLACVQLYCGTAGLGWLEFSSIAGLMA